MSYEEMMDKYNNLVMNRLTYYGLISAIPQSWKRTLLNQRNGVIVENAFSTPEKLYAMDKVCQKSYPAFVQKNVKGPNTCTGKRKWEHYLGLEYDTEDYCTLFNNIYKYTPSTKLRAFQYLLLHMAIVTNVDLFKWKKKNTANCSFCNQHPETTMHMLWECNSISVLWREIFTWLDTQTETQIRFTPQEIILGSGQDTLLLYDLVFLVAKQFIYACRCLGVHPTLQGFVQKIKKLYVTETEAATLHNKSEKCIRKWAPLFQEQTQAE